MTNRQQPLTSTTREALPPLPKKRKAMFCTKCGFSGPTDAEASQGGAPCQRCQYIAFVEEVDYSDDEMQAYARAALATQPAQPSAQGEAVARELLNRMLEAPTTHIRASWKDAIREALLKTSPTEAVAWLVEWKAHGDGPQWWGFNHTPGKSATWCSDANNAIRFARKEDAERMRLHIIAVAGLTGMHEYERNVSVTEHLWEVPCRAE